jgi:hypothetical protein
MTEAELFDHIKSWADEQAEAGNGKRLCRMMGYFSIKSDEGYLRAKEDRTEKEQHKMEQRKKLGDLRLEGILQGKFNGPIHHDL